MPTGRGRALLGGSVACYVFARLLSNDELFAVAVAALVLPLLSLAFVRVGSHRLGFARAHRPRRIFAGGTLRIESVVQNLGRLPSPPLYVEDEAPGPLGGPVRAAVPWMRAQGKLSYVAERTASARGRYVLGPMRARLVDPFGLAEASAAVAARASVVVFPRIDPLHESSPPEARGGAGATHAFRLAASGDEFYAIRDYQEGDDLRKIHWRSSARRGELMIRQDEVRPTPRATILVDTRAAVHRDPSSLEWAISAAASLVWELARQGFGLRVATADGGPGAWRWGREAADPLLGTLATAERSGARTLRPVLRRASALPAAGGALIALVPPPAPDLAPSLARLARAYSWCGAVLLDTASFAHAPARERAAADQGLAGAERSLVRAGWRVVTAGGNDRFPFVWQTLLDLAASRPRRASLRS